MILPDHLHPDMQILLDARESVGGTPVGEKTTAAYRAFWELYYRAIPNPRPDSIEAVDRMIPIDDEAGGHEVPVRIYRRADMPANLPANLSAEAPAGAPCVIYLHGGGFVLGDLESSDILAWGFTAEADAVTISVDYRLAPEHPYPAALEDTYGVLFWAHDNAAELGIDPARIALVGDSAGGCLSTAACLLSQELDGPPVAAQVMIYPVTGIAMDSPSYMENADAVGLTAASMKFFLENYLKQPPDWADSLARPVLAELEDLSGLPPAFVHTAEFDPIRDDGRIYAAMLAQAGCNVTYREVPGMIHGFYRLRLASDAAAREYGEACDFLKRIWRG
ncbi:MAG: alpha/beta hydrolase [Rhodospirillales bacterium]|nr:alpha/beta hydrolase [Rhodospirillales bacterium]